MSDRRIVGWVVGLCVVGFAVAVPTMMHLRRERGEPDRLPVSISSSPSTKAAHVETVEMTAPATRPATVPVVVAATQPAKRYRVHGAAWLNRNNGSSDLMRGMPITLMRKEVSRVSVLESVAEIDKVWERDWITIAEVDRSKNARQLITELRNSSVSRMDALAAYNVLAKISRNGVVPFNSWVVPPDDCTLLSLR